MVEIEFIDGTREDVECDGDDGFIYDTEKSMFKVPHNGHWIMYPREFVKSIRYISVD